MSQVTARFTTENRSSVILEIENRGVISSKRVSIKDFSKALNGSIRTEKRGKYVTLGVPQGTFDIFVDDEDVKNRVYVVAQQAGKQFTTCSCRNGGEYQGYIRYPSLVFLIEAGKKGHRSYCFAYKGNLSYQTELFQFPFGNVSLNDGNICFGNLSMNVKNQLDIDELILAFYAGKYNGDYYEPYGQTNTGLDLISLMESLDAFKVDAFPEGILMPTGKTLLEVCKKLGYM